MNTEMSNQNTAVGNPVVERVRHWLQANQEQVITTLPAHVKPERFIRLLLTELTRNPALGKCNPASVVEGVLQCARLGLYPGPAPVGRVHLVPYGKDCNLVIDYKGLIELARRSGEISSVRAEVIYEQEVVNGSFKESSGAHPDLHHIPLRFGDKGRAVGAYAVAFFKDGTADWEILNMTDIEKAKASSPTGKRGGGVWASHFEEMAKKTAIRRLCKRLPLAEELEDGLMADTDADPTIIDADTGNQASAAPAAAAKRLKQYAEPVGGGVIEDSGFDAAGDE